MNVSSEMLANDTSFGGNVVTKEYKDIDGYPVPWGTYTSHYTNLRWQLDESFYAQTVERRDQHFGRQAFQPGTAQKKLRAFTLAQRACQTRPKHSPACLITSARLPSPSSTATPMQR